MTFVELIETLVKLGVGAGVWQAVQSLIAMRGRNREQDTTLTLADKAEVARVNKATQERLERQVDKLLAEWLEAVEQIQQLQIAKTVLEFKVTQGDETIAALREQNQALHNRLNGGTTATEE